MSDKLDANAAAIDAWRGKIKSVDIVRRFAHDLTRQQTHWETR